MKQPVHAMAGIILLATACGVQGETIPVPKTRTYQTFNWNVRAQRAVNRMTVSHPYAALSKEEIDPATGCTVCMEDQQLLQIGTIKPFYVCRRIADKVRGRLERLLAAGEPVLEVTAYRPGKTRNPLDQYGNRTGFSNHAYGSAVDINRSWNGLYEDCPRVGRGCRLAQGGAWIPGNIGTLTQDSPIVLGMKESGFKWGGDIAGDQKDFMHFSISGY